MRRAATVLDVGTALPARPHQLKLGIVAPIEMHKNVPFMMFRLDRDRAMLTGIALSVEPTNASEMCQGDLAIA